MVHCCIPGCKNTHHHKTKKEEWHVDTRNYSLHDLPSEDRMEIRELWILAINRSTLPKDVAVCSDHFTEDCFDEKWEEYKRKYGPTKVKRKLKLDAVPTLFPGRMFYHEKVQHIKESWKNKVLQRRLEYERLRLEKEYRDRFKSTQTECQCKCRCKLRKKNFGQQVNFQFKFMEDVGVQFPKDLTETVKDDHSYTQGGKKKTKTGAANTKPIAIATDATAMLNIISTDPQPVVPPVVPPYTIDFENVTGGTSTQTSTIDHKDAATHFVIAGNIQADILGFQLKHKLVQEATLSDENILEKRQRLEQETLISNEPSVLQNEPQVLQNDPQVLQNERQVLQNDPQVLQNDPQVLQNDPQVLQNDPQVLQNDPQVLQNDPSVLQNEPQLLQNEHPILQNNTPILPSDTSVLPNQ